MKGCSLSGTSAVWIPAEDPDASVLIKPANGKEFTLKELQTAVGGYTELVRLLHAHPSSGGLGRGCPVRSLQSVPGRPCWCTAAALTRKS